MSNRKFTSGGIQGAGAAATNLASSVMSSQTNTKTNTKARSSGETLLPKAVLVHSGARDAYQLAIALEEAGMLEALVTDLYWPADRPWAERLSHLLPAQLKAALLRRNAAGLPSGKVQMCAIRGLATLLLDKLGGRVPFSWKRRSTRSTDAALGERAGLLANDRGAGLVSYSYYGYHAFSKYKRPGMLFQLHPHPASVRRLLQRELADHPDCAASLMKEWELALPQADFDRLLKETAMSSRFLAASSFTRRTLIENGVDREAIRVIPYGIDSKRFCPLQKHWRSSHKTLRLLFVGRINQRKGVKYLLEAMRLLDSRDVQLTICGRPVDSLELFEHAGAKIQVRPSVSSDELLAAYREADLFVFPSVAEGFGQVLLESLACGLPILSTTHTAAPDLIEDGVQGFIVAPRRPDLLANRIEWALTHREALDRMRSAARARAELFTWERFRSEVALAVCGYLAAQASVADRTAQNV